ncbi:MULTISPECIES: hypothetical protein [Oxalobacteraceae]|jgi:hypothetical protein|uniref:hypothetical protein n=1 Tax=Oxalobacteraceae TaxID=75682 RepID=UPI0010A5664A|nr:MULTISPECIES: hypothetical protein [Oxalobacteraceae]
MVIEKRDVQPKSHCAALAPKSAKYALMAKYQFSYKHIFFLFRRMSKPVVSTLICCRRRPEGLAD